MKIFFLTPTIDASVNYDYCASMYRTAEVLKEHNVDSELLFLAGCPAVDRARDILIAKFMESDCTHFMQIDADIGWYAEDILKLLAHDVDFVGGVYPIKKEKPEFRVNFNDKRKKGLIGADGMPGGFCLIKRNVIERMMEKYPDLVGRNLDEADEVYGLHTHTVEDGVFYGEDMSFAKRARDAGIEMYVDPTINLRHWNGGTCYDHKLIGNLIQLKAS
jgi:hypothetical protein